MYILSRGTFPIIINTLEAVECCVYARNDDSSFIAEGKESFARERFILHR